MKTSYKKPELEIININSQIVTDVKSGIFDLEDEDEFL